MNYQEYLHSAAWRQRASQAKQRAHWQCQECGNGGNKSSLHAHHKTYQRLGHERDDDIIILCEECHSNKHMRATARNQEAAQWQQLMESLTANRLSRERTQER